MKYRQRALLLALLVLLTLLACGLGAFYVWIGQPAKPVAQVALVGLTHERSIYSPVGAKTAAFTRPSRIAVTPEGELLVSDGTAKAVLRISEEGDLLGRLTPKEVFVIPGGVGVWPDGTIWVADWPKSRIIVFNATGAETKRIEQLTPLSINIVKDRAYVTGSGSVNVYNQAGRLLTMYGRGRGAGAGQLDMPHGVVPVGKDIVIGDSLNSRLVRLAPDNTPVWSVGFRKKGMNNAPEGPYNLPSDVLIGQKGFIFVADRFTCQITIVDPKTGKVLRTVGEMGSKDGQFMYPDGFVYLGGDRYAIADTWNSRIQIVRIPLPGAAAETAVANQSIRVGPGDVGLLLLWCAVPLGVLLLALLVFLVIRGRAGRRVRAEDEIDVMEDTPSQE
jgi:DNA-binding beta-propeller fold protein YncE